MIINKPHLVTHLEVWAPRYSSRYDKQYGERVALLHRSKVFRATPQIIVEFTRAKHLVGQRFAITREDAMRHEIGTNGAEPDNMYVIPMSHLEWWGSDKEVIEEISKLWPQAKEIK